MATLLTKKSDTASSVPLAGDLTNAAGGAELAVNTADKKLYVKNSSGTVVELTGLKPTDIGVSVQAYDAELSTLAGMSSSRATYLASTEGFGFRNRIINGDMRIDQRSAGASTTVASNGYYSCDRWKTYTDPASKYAIQQNAGAVTPPAGFSKYLGITSASAYSVGSGDYFWLEQSIEGNNIQDLAWGTASAATVTLSFWVRSSLTGQFGGSLTNAGRVRAYPFSYTINAANTWEQKTITVAGDTSGTWATGNTAGLLVIFDLGCGSTYLRTAGSWGGDALGSTGDTKIVATSGATFYITGVQLEAGSVASPFERRDYGRELMMAQRYCLVDSNTSQAYRAFGNGVAANTTQGYIVRQLPVTMRTTPSVTVSSGTAFLGDVGGVAPTTTGVTDNGYGTPLLVRVAVTVASGWTAGQALVLVSDGSSSSRTITYSAEL